MNAYSSVCAGALRAPLTASALRAERRSARGTCALSCSSARGIAFAADIGTAAVSVSGAECAVAVAPAPGRSARVAAAKDGGEWLIDHGFDICAGRWALSARALRTVRDASAVAEVRYARGGRAAALSLAAGDGLIGVARLQCGAAEVRVRAESGEWRAECGVRGRELSGGAEVRAADGAVRVLKVCAAARAQWGEIGVLWREGACACRAGCCAKGVWAARNVRVALERECGGACNGGVAFDVGRCGFGVCVNGAETVLSSVSADVGRCTVAAALQFGGKFEHPLFDVSVVVKDTE